MTILEFMLEMRVPNDIAEAGLQRAKDLGFEYVSAKIVRLLAARKIDEAIEEHKRIVASFREQSRHQKQ